VIDYHLHLWPHSESSVWFKLDQIADYCDEAARHGVTELALTEHTSRFATYCRRSVPSGCATATSRRARCWRSTWTFTRATPSRST